MKITPLDLEINKCDGRFVLTYAGRPIVTPEGHEVTHSTPDLLEHMISEFDLQGSLTLRAHVVDQPKFFGAYALYSIQKSWIEQNREELWLNFGECLQGDRMLHRSAGPEGVDQMARWSSVLDYLGELGLQLPSRTSFYDDPGLYSDEKEYRDMKRLATLDPAFVRAVEAKYREMEDEQRTVTMHLFAIHQNVVLFPLVLSLGRCTPEEYSSGVLAAHALLAEVFADFDQKQHRNAWLRLRDDARTAADYIRYYRARNIILEEITSGESRTREFKSTLRWNVKAERFDESVTHACLKTLAAFLNTQGGTLLIGVDDSGAVVGIELDQFPNADKFIVHLGNVVRQAMGSKAATLIDGRVHRSKGKLVCRVECSKSDEPVFLKFKSSEEEFFVRHGPSSTKLSVSEVHPYISSRFPRDSSKLPSQDGS